MSAVPAAPPPPARLDGSAPANAEERSQPAASISGRDMFVLAECPGGTIPLRLISPTQPVAIRTGDIAPRPAAPPPSWSVEWSKPAPADEAADEWVSTGTVSGGCPRPGLFTVPLTVYDAKRQTTPLAITLVREVQPVLDIPSAVTLSVNRAFGLPGAASFVLRETEPGASEVRLSVAGGELRTAGGDATGITLEAANSPLTLRAGQAARVELAPSAAPSPGSYSAKLLVNSPSLRQPAVVDIAYRVRLDVLFLVATLLVGVALGWWVNLRLAARAALDAAVLSGLRAIQSVTRRVTPQRDPAVQQRLLAVANLLQSNLEEAGSPDQIGAHVAEAETQAKEIESRAVESATSLQSTLQTARSMLRPSGAALDDALTVRLGPALSELDALQSSADNGDIEGTTVKLHDFMRELPGKVMPELRNLLADMQSELGGAGKLPKTAGLEASRAELQEAVRSAYGQSELQSLIRATDGVARRLRSWMDLSLPVTLATLWRDASRVLNTSKPMLAQRLGFAAEQADQLRRASRDPLTRLASISAFRKAVMEALSDAAEGDRAVEEAIKEGDIRQAARLLAKSNEPEPPEPKLEAVAPEVKLVAPAATTSAALRIKPLIPLGQDSLATVRWIGERPSPERIVWHCHPPQAAAVEPTASGALVHPRQPGFLLLSVEVDGTRLAEVRTYSGEVNEQNFHGIAMRERQSTRLAITFVSAVLTVFAGYAILEPSWFGTFGDFARAFLWGCFGQFALDRIRELSRPLLSRTVPI